MSSYILVWARYTKCAQWRLQTWEFMLCVCMCVFVFTTVLRPRSIATEVIIGAINFKGGE